MSHPVGRRAWSLAVRQKEFDMANGLNSKAADEEARAEVEVLNSRLEKTRQLNKKIQASLTRLNANGRSMADAMGPIYKNTQNLQTEIANIEGVLAALGRIRQPSDIKSQEDSIIKRGPERAGLSAFLSSITRVSDALSELQRTNLRANQEAVADLGRLLQSGNTQLEVYFAKLVQEESRPIEPLHYITKDKEFPRLHQDHTTRLGLISNYVANNSRRAGFNESPILKVYASVRGPYLISTLQNLASASVNTARKKTPEAMYRQGTNGIGTYAKGIEGVLLAEYDNICSLFSRDEWGRVFNLTCQGAVADLARTIQDLNTHIKANLNTDCYLAYEIIEIISNLSASLESRTGELKNALAKALKPIKETGKLSLGDLLEDTRRRISSLQVIPPDGAAVPLTAETMSRLQTMVDFLRPISSIMISIGDGGWKTNVASNSSSEQIPSLASFDVTADGKQIFAHYCVDTIEALLSGLDVKAKTVMKSKQVAGVFIANNVTIIDRMIRGSDLQPLLVSGMGDIDKWLKTGVQMYTGAWREATTHLFTVQYTNRGGRPTSGSANAVDSAAILKTLTSKERDVIKKKFLDFNAAFDELVARHKSMNMEREVRDKLSHEVQALIEQMYIRFFDKYHEIDKGRGKYVKYSKADISGVFLSLAKG